MSTQQSLPTLMYQTRILETGSTFAMETDGTWLMADFDHDDIPDLVFIKTSNCATGTVEVHVASGKSDYKERILETGTTFAMEDDGTWLMADFDNDGIPDLVFIKTSNCGTNTVEIHVASGVSNYQERILETGTIFAMEDNGTWLIADFNNDGKPDLVYIKTSNCGTNTVEVHVASAASNYQERIWETGSTFAMENDGAWLLANFEQDSPRPDLVFIKTSNCGTNTVEVHVASGASGYEQRILETGTTFAMENNGTWTMADFYNAQLPDLVFIKTSNCGTNTVEVHVSPAIAS